MDEIILKERFLNLLLPPLPSDWEAEENLEHLVELPEQRQDLILHHVKAIWPVSNSLCYSYLSFADKALTCLNDDQLGEWVAAFLDIYEKEGLKEAQTFMMDVESNFLCLLRGENGVKLDDVVTRLLPYAGGIAQKRISIKEGQEIYTDTESIFLPNRIMEFIAEKDNFLLYKLAVTAQLTLISLRTYDLSIPIKSSLMQNLRKRYHPSSLPDKVHIEDFWSMFPDPRLAESIFTLSVGFQISEVMARDYPGLWKDTIDLREELLSRRGSLSRPCIRSRILESFTRQLITGRKPEEEDPGSILGIFSSEKPAAEKTAAIYALLDEVEEPYETIDPPLWLGKLRPKEAREVRERERAEIKQKFVETLAAILPENPASRTEDLNENDKNTEKPSRLHGDDFTALLIPPGSSTEEDSSAGDQSNGSGQSLVVGGQDIEMPESIKVLAADIISDLGYIPEEYISAAQGFSGSGNPSRADWYSAEGESLKGRTTYDEWDYRRAGFRKDWCILNEKKVKAVKGSFVSNTLEKYSGLLISLKKQFEMLRSAERFIKRQREGDDIDLDAVIESISDVRAGRPESDKLFIKLRHDDRDIGVLFLIDMSSSTEGWVGEALKEALILMGESLEVLGDRYAIAGFSGMRRTRSEFFHIKDFDEPYNEQIRGRIAAISPQEYTRMGPPVRHATKMLQKVDAKVRLLIVLSDGKPEDYDDYKGEYAIEDTRHALIEAKAAGIHPFCITIDKEAHDYNAHMYGAVNYIFLDKVKDLPVRMPAIYRNLTT